MVEDRLANAVQIACHFVVPEPQHQIATLLQIARPLSILLRHCVVTMVAAVQFHDEPCIRAAEIHDEGSDRHLPLELPAGNAPPSQLTPEQAFGIRLAAAERTRKRGAEWSRTHRQGTPLTLPSPRRGEGF